MMFIIISIVITYFIIILYFHFKYPEIRWDWNNISTTNTKFPSSFIIFLSYTLYLFATYRKRNCLYNANGDKAEHPLASIT